MEFLLEHDGSDVMRPLSADDATLASIKGRISHLGGRLLLSRTADSAPRRARLVLPLPITTSDSTSATPHPAPLS
jgi:hypothetical protein